LVLPGGRCRLERIRARMAELCPPMPDGSWSGPRVTRNARSRLPSHVRMFAMGSLWHETYPREVAWRARRPSHPRWMAGHVGTPEGAVCAIARTIRPAGGSGRHAVAWATAYRNPDDFTCQTPHRRAAGRRELQRFRRTKREKLAPFTTLGASYDGNGS
jgi:hypothetical protein